MQLGSSSIELHWRLWRRSMQGTQIRVATRVGSITRSPVNRNNHCAVGPISSGCLWFSADTTSNESCQCQCHSCYRCDTTQIKAATENFGWFRLGIARYRSDPIRAEDWQPASNECRRRCRTPDPSLKTLEDFPPYSTLLHFFPSSGSGDFSGVVPEDGIQGPRLAPL